MPPTTSGAPSTNLWSQLKTLSQNGVFDVLVGMGGIPYYVSGGGNDAGFGGLSSPKKTIAAVYPLLRTGKHDFIVILGDPTNTASCTVRMDAAFNWNKAATHLIGQAGPVLLGQRARIAPTSTTTAFTPFFTVSASGCIFQNVEWFMGFGTG